MQGLQALDQFKSFVSSIGGLGRYEDTYIVHAAEGETVVPMEVLDQNPVLKKRLFKTMMEMGIEPGRYIVGNELNSKNPVTGQPEFFLKKIGRRLRKAAADISGYAAPIVGAMYGPAAGAAVGAALGQYKRENPGDPNQGMQMALRGGLSGVASNYAGGKTGLDAFTGKGLSGETFRNPLDIFSDYVGEGSGANYSKYFKNQTGPNKGKYKMFDAFRGGGKGDLFDRAKKYQTDALAKGFNVSDAEALEAARKGGIGPAGMSLKDIMLYGGLGTGILGKLIEGGQQDGGDAQIATNRIDNTQIFDPTIPTTFAAKGGVMDLQDGGESKGPGTGTSDSIPAMLSDGEFVMTAKAVRGAGGGDRREGARKMYEAMDQLEAKA